MRALGERVVAAPRICGSMLEMCGGAFVYRAVFEMSKFFWRRGMNFLGKQGRGGNYKDWPPDCRGIGWILAIHAGIAAAIGL